MTRTLPSVIAQSGGLNPADGRAVRRLIDKADELMIGQVKELGHIPSTKRRRYWRCLLQAMIEDQAITFGAEPGTQGTANP